MHLLPYSSCSFSKTKRLRAAAEDDVGVEGGSDPALAVDTDEDEDNIELDSMIKAGFS